MSNQAQDPAPSLQSFEMLLQRHGLIEADLAPEAAQASWRLPYAHLPSQNSESLLAAAEYLVEPNDNLTAQQRQSDSLRYFGQPLDN